MRLSHDVFRAPRFSLIFSVIIGMGFQYTIVSFIFLLITNIGLQTGAHEREYLYLIFLALSALTGSIGGFMSARMYVLFNGARWRLHSFITVFAVPIEVMMCLAAMSYAESLELTRFGESRTYEFDKVFLIWALFDIPNVAIGCWLGYRAEKLSVPVKPSRVPRTIPPLS